MGCAVCLQMGARREARRAWRARARARRGSKQGHKAHHAATLEEGVREEERVTPRRHLAHRQVLRKRGERGPRVSRGSLILRGILEAWPDTIVRGEAGRRRHRFRAGVDPVLAERPREVLRDDALDRVAPRYVEDIRIERLCERHRLREEGKGMKTQGETRSRREVSARLPRRERAAAWQSTSNRPQDSDMDCSGAAGAPPGACSGLARALAAPSSGTLPALRIRNTGGATTGSPSVLGRTRRQLAYPKDHRPNGLFTSDRKVILLTIPA